MKNKPAFNEWQRNHRRKRKQPESRVFKYATDERLRRDRAAKLNWNHNNREYRAEQHMKTRYGITKAQRDDLLVKQGNACALNHNHVESTDLSPGKRGGFWHIDHDHHTDKVRGILCRTCNTALGAFGDNVAGVELALNYLHKHYGLDESDDEHF